MRVVYATAGDVGVGDLVHGLALRAAAQRSGLPITVTVLSATGRSDGGSGGGGAAAFPALRHVDDLHHATFSPREIVAASTARSSALAAALRALRPDVVVVGQFWMPFQHIVGGLDVPAALLLRKAPAIWVQGPAALPFSSSSWTRVIETEPVGFGVVGSTSAPPLVVCNPDELLDAATARAQLLAGRVDDGRPLRLVFQAGNVGEAQQLATSSPSLDGVAVVPMGGRADGQGLHGRRAMQTRVIDLRDDDAPFPVARLLLGADEVVSGAGYNAFWEARWLGTAHKTHLVALPRSIDDQAWRLSLSTTTMTANGADVLIGELWAAHGGGRGRIVDASREGV